MRARLLLGLVFLSIAASATAQEVRRQHHNVNVSVGREGRLGYYASPDESCKQRALPQVAIVEQPNYGNISVRPDRIVAYSSTIRGSLNGCRGKAIDAAAIYYKPAKGFHGSDRVVLRVIFPAVNGAVSTLYDTVYISVR